MLVGEGKSLSAEEIMSASAVSVCDGNGSGTSSYSGSSTENYDSYVVVGGASTVTRRAIIEFYYADYHDYYDNPAIMYPEHGTYNNDFINLHTGHLTLKHDDIAVDGAVIPVAFSHYYASLSRDEAAQTATATL